VSEISILLVGNAERSEFRAARESLHALGRVTEVREAESAAALLAAGEVVADVIVLAQALPGQFSQPIVDRLRRLAPLARVLGLLGSWCEGEMRTGRPWPGVIRVYWHQWLPRCGAQFARLLRGECPAFGLPVTATDEERMLLTAEAPPARLQGLVAIYARSPQMQDWLSAACRSRGCATVWLRPPRPAKVEGAAAAIFDAAELAEPQCDELRQLAAALRPGPVIALLDFPRSEDRRRALAAGAATVLSKPLNIDDLFWELDRLLRGER
jgi:hypothetical protein